MSEEHPLTKCSMTCLRDNRGFEDLLTSFPQSSNGGWLVNNTLPSSVTFPPTGYMVSMFSPCMIFPPGIYHQCTHFVEKILK